MYAIAPMSSEGSHSSNEYKATPRPKTVLEPEPLHLRRYSIVVQCQN